MKHVLSIRDFKPGELFNDLIPACLKQSEKVKNLRSGGANLPPQSINKAVLAFIEPSTRTVGSYRDAVELLNWRISDLNKKDSNSLSKHESFANTARMEATNGANLLVVRSEIEGLPRFLAEILERQGFNVAIHNAGDGRNQHPTQTVLDLATIINYKKTCDGQVFGFVGDHTNSRTVHSLLQALSYCKDVKIMLLSSPELRLQKNFWKILPNIIEVNSFEQLGTCQAIYYSRIQKERNPLMSEERLLELRRKFALTPERMKFLKNDCIIMHALPYAEDNGLSDFSPDVLYDPRVVIFEQAGFGVPCRLELIQRSLKMISEKGAIFNPTPIAFDKVVEESLSEYLGKRQQRRGQKNGEEHFRPITSGTVLDHIPSDLSLRIAYALKRDGLLSEGVKGVLWDVNSKDMGKKEIFLMEGIHLPEEVMLKIGAIAPSITFNIIKNGVFTKLRIKDGSHVEKTGTCPNKSCVTNIEPEAKTRFIHEGGLVRCHYCELVFSSHEIMT